MTDYKQFRTDFAKAFFIEMTRRLPVFSNQQLPGTEKVGDMEKIAAIRLGIAQAAVANADNLIAELERTEVPQPEPVSVRVGGWHLDQKGEVTKNAQPAPDLPRLNTGWKWAPKDGTHFYTPYDAFVYDVSPRTLTIDGYRVGAKYDSSGNLATPDWHNPENIAAPGEGWRFLVKGEERIKFGDEYRNPKQKVWCVTMYEGIPNTLTYRTPATRPLPPVLADEKEAQS